MRGLLSIIVSMVVLLACSSPPLPTPVPPTSTPVPTPTPVPRPKPEVVGQSVTDIGGLFDTAVRVTCAIRNGGDTGSVTVSGFLDGQNGAWTKRATSVIGAGETRTFDFDFPEIEFALFGDNSYTHRCEWELS